LPAIGHKALCSRDATGHLPKSRGPTNITTLMFLTLFTAIDLQDNSYCF
jgi:hypothetical protein